MFLLHEYSLKDLYRKIFCKKKLKQSLILIGSRQPASLVIGLCTLDYDVPQACLVLTQHENLVKPQATLAPIHLPVRVFTTPTGGLTWAQLGVLASYLILFDKLLVIT